MVKKNRLYIYAIIILVVVILVALILLLTKISDFNTCNIDISKVHVNEVKAYSQEAYYLTDDGVLLSPGADIDSSCYVVYIDDKNGIVGENVKFFGYVIGGGYYLTNDGFVYYWNHKDMPAFNYASKKQQVIIDDVVSVDFYNNDMIYIDYADTLYYVGETETVNYTVNNPKIICENVEFAHISSVGLTWKSKNGVIGYSGTNSVINECLYEINQKYSSISQYKITENGIFFVFENDLYYCGDYNSLITNNKTNNEKIEITFLVGDVKLFDCDNEKVVTVDSKGDTYLWGRYISSTENSSQTWEYEYFEKKLISKDIATCTFAETNICLVTNDGRTKIYGFSGVWGFCGNSVSDQAVGINDEPIIWKETAN